MLMSSVFEIGYSCDTRSSTSSLANRCDQTDFHRGAVFLRYKEIMPSPAKSGRESDALGDWVSLSQTPSHITAHYHVHKKRAVSSWMSLLLSKERQQEREPLLEMSDPQQEESLLLCLPHQLGRRPLLFKAALGRASQSSVGQAPYESSLGVLALVCRQSERREDHDVFRH